MPLTWTDARHSARGLMRTPAFTAIAVATLAPGVGANTALFSVIDAVLLRPLPFADADRLVAVWSTDVRQPRSKLPVSLPDIDDWRAQSRTIERFGTWFTIDLTLTGDGEALRVKGKGVDGDLLRLLGVAPLHGRLLQRGDHYAVVLSHDFWRRRFDADPAVVGRGVTLGDERYTIVGVMPSGFQFPIEAELGDLWLTWDVSKIPNAPIRRDLRLSEAIGRLRPGTTIAGAQAEMALIAARLRQHYPETNRDIGAHVMPLDEHLTGGHRQALLVLFGAVGCVLLIACVNVANLLLARATTRGREMAVRTALGASRWRIGRHLLTESLFLSLMGGTLGILIARGGVRTLTSLNPAFIPGADRSAIDTRVLVFTLAVATITAVCFGLMQTWRLSRLDVTTALRDGDRGTEGAAGTRLRHALVVAEIALALVLLVGGGLLLNSMWRLMHVDPGFDPRNVLTFRVSLSYAKYAKPPQVAAFYRDLQTGLERLPGVRAASVVMPLPFNGDPDFSQLGETLDTRLDIEGRPVPRPERPRIDSLTVQPTYFRAMGIRLVAGRDFDVRDDSEAPPVAIINEAMAERHFPNENPLGRRLRIDSRYSPNERMRRIVGVVANVKPRSLHLDARAEMYVPFAQAPFQEMFVVVKSDVAPESIVGAVRGVVHGLDRDQPIFNVMTLDQRLGASMADRRFSALLLGSFAMLALVLAAAGLYGVLSYTIAQRTREIGVRMALGAQPSEVLRMVAGEGLRLTGLGLVLGLAGAAVLTRLLTHLLFDISATDPLTFVLVAVVLASVAWLACYVPARRAATVDPLIALRHD